MHHPPPLSPFLTSGLMSLSDNPVLSSRSFVELFVFRKSARCSRFLPTEIQLRKILKELYMYVESPLEGFPGSNWQRMAVPNSKRLSKTPTLIGAILKPDDGSQQTRQVYSHCTPGFFAQNRLGKEDAGWSVFFVEEWHCNLTSRLAWGARTWEWRRIGRSCRKPPAKSGK